MKKTIIAIATAGVIAVSLAGCGNATTSTSSSSANTATSLSSAEEADTNTAIEGNLGEQVEATTKYGNVGITVDSLLLDESLTSLNQEYLGDDEEVATLNLIVENISYFDKLNPDYIDISQCMSLIDSDGISLNALQSFNSQGSGMYEHSTDFVESPKEGESRRVAVLYAVKEGSDNFTVSVGNTNIPVTLTTEG